MTKQRYNVRIVPLGSEGQVRACNVVAADERAAAGRAIARLYGGRAFWHTGDGQLGWRYGQVFETLPNTGSGWSATSRTPLSRLDIVEGWRGE